MSNNISANDVKALREKTGAGMMDCKKALSESNGNMDAAIDYLRKKGLADSQKKQVRIAAEGYIDSYIHNGKIGVMVEVNCETDFVAKNENFRTFVRDVAMHVAAADPKFIHKDDIDEGYKNKEAEIFKNLEACRKYKVKLPITAELRGIKPQTGINL